MANGSWTLSTPGFLIRKTVTISILEADRAAKIVHLERMLRRCVSGCVRVSVAWDSSTSLGMTGAMFFRRDAPRLSA